MSVARFIADQRTLYRVPHTITCVLLRVSLAWFYKWLDRPATPRQQRRAEVDAAVRAMFDDAKGGCTDRPSCMPICARMVGS
jgi:putative transposase